MTAAPTGWPMVIVPLRRPHRVGRPCPASGWGVTLGATRGDGTVVCPVCTQVVATRHDRLLGPRVHVVDDHTVTCDGG